jgi:hypothetical protein
LCCPVGDVARVVIEQLEPAAKTRRDAGVNAHRRLPKPGDPVDAFIAQEVLAGKRPFGQNPL